MPIFKKVTFLLALAMCLMKTGKAQTSYTLDTEFSQNVGNITFGGHIANSFIEDDGKIVVSGSFSDNIDIAEGFARLHINGSPDQSFSFENNFTASGYNSGQAVRHNGHYLYEKYGCVHLNGTNPCDSAIWVNILSFPPYYSSGNSRSTPVSVGDTMVVYPGRFTIDLDNPGSTQVLVALGQHGHIKESFPLFQGEPNIGSIAYEIEPIPGGGYYLAGRWSALRGYDSPSIVRLTESFEIDTTFKSPFTWGSISGLSADSLGRPWFNIAQASGETFNDTLIPLIRLTTDGSIDTSFSLPEFDNYTTEWFTTFKFVEDVIDDGAGYIIGGQFGSVNGEERICLAKLTDSGELMPDFSGIDLLRSHNWPDYSMPWISNLDLTSEGNLIVTGKFNDVNDATCHNIMRFNPTPVSAVATKSPFKKLKVYPNPTTGQVALRYETQSSIKPKEVRIYDVNGRLLKVNLLPPTKKNEIHLFPGGLKPRLYFLELSTEDGRTAREKLILNKTR